MGLPTACELPAAGGIAKSVDCPTARRLRRLLHFPPPHQPPPALRAFPRMERRTSGRPAPPTGAPFPQRPLPHQPRASFPPQVRGQRPPPERAPRSLLADSRDDQPPATGRSAMLAPKPSARTSPSLFSGFRPGMTKPPPPASGKSLPPLPATASKGCRNGLSPKPFVPGGPTISA